MSKEVDGHFSTQFSLNDVDELTPVCHMEPAVLEKKGRINKIEGSHIYLLDPCKNFMGNLSSVDLLGNRTTHNKVP